MTFDFDSIWPTLPPGMRRCGRPNGRKMFERAKAQAIKEYGEEAEARFMGGLKAYIAGKEEWRAWLHFSTFCNQGFWDVDPADYEDPGQSYEERRERSRRLMEQNGLRVIK